LEAIRLKADTTGIVRLRFMTFRTVAMVVVVDNEAF
jgi:hypothetical protein